MPRPRAKTPPEPLPATSVEHQEVPGVGISDQASATLQDPTSAALPDGSEGALLATEAETREATHLGRATVVRDQSARMAFHHNYDARPQKAAITFDDGKPSEQILQTLREAGFRWNGSEIAWEKEIHFATRAQDRLEAQAVFDRLVRLRRAELGVSQER